jgi:hypothetical protein
MDKKMGKRKLTCVEKAEKKRRRAEYMTIFVHGKQKRKLMLGERTRLSAARHNAITAQRIHQINPSASH